MIRNPEGLLCTSPAQALDTWIQFFQEMEGGKRMEQGEQRRLWIRHLEEFRSQTLTLEVTEVPVLG